MVCDAPWDSHEWTWTHGRLVCLECGLDDLPTARLRRDVLRALEDRGLIRRVDGPEPAPP
jgi:hypothetical protein